MFAYLRKNEIVAGSVYGVFHFLVLPSLAAAVFLFSGAPEWVIQFGIFLFSFLASVVIYRHYLLQSCKDALEKPVRFLSFSVLALALFYALFLTVNYFIFSIEPDYKNLNDEGITELVQVGGIWIILGTVILAPVAEECLFRGLLFRAIYERHPALAWIISPIAFSAVHLLAYANLYDAGTMALAFLQYLPAGMALCFAYKATGSILSPMLVHGVINLISVLTLTR